MIVLLKKEMMATISTPLRGTSILDLSILFSRFGFCYFFVE